MKRVLHVTKAYWPHLGGVETVVRQLAEGAVSLGWEVKVLCLGQEDQEICLNGVIVRRVKTSGRLGSAPLSLKFFSEFKRLKDWANIIHFHIPNPMGEIAFLFSGKGTARTAMCTYHSDPVRPEWAASFYRPILAAFVKKCDKVVATSPAYAQSSPILSRIHVKVGIIPLGVDPSLFETIPNRYVESIKSKINDAGSPLALFVGRLVYYKGVDILLRAVESVPGLRLVILGAGPMKEELVELTDKLGLQERVHFLSFLPPEEYSAIFYCADFLVLPSVERTEAFGLVALEAMAAGLPVITTELGTGTSYYNENGKTGMVVPPREVDELAKAMTKLANSAELRKEMGSRSKEQVNRFTVDRMLKSYLEAYETGEIQG